MNDNDRFNTGLFQIYGHFLSPFCHFRFMDPKLLFNLASLPIPKLITFEGKDINEYISAQDGFTNTLGVKELEKLDFNLSKIANNISAIANKTDDYDRTEAILNIVEPYEIDFFHDQAIEIYKWLFPWLEELLSSINALFPSYPSDDEKKEIDKICIVTDKMSRSIANIEDTIKSLLDISFFDLLSGNNKKSSIAIRLQKLFYCILPALILDGYIALISIVALHQSVYEHFCIPEEKRTQPDMLPEMLQKIDALMRTLDHKLDYISSGTQQMNSNLDTVGKTTERIVKGQDEIQRKIAVQGDKSDRKLEKLEDTVNKRNRADKRKPLTQEECATILYKQKINYFQKKENYLRFVGMTATKPKLPKDEKSVERTIQRWDQYLSSDGEKGTKPPKGYSRERSRKEFEAWAEALEQIAYEKWEKEQPIIRRKNKRDGLVSTHSPEKEDEENLEEENDDQETRGQGNLVDRVAHPTKRD